MPGNVCLGYGESMGDGYDLVTVIIPTYNRAIECKLSVESVLSQTHGNVEVIVVDDGSIDNTGELICGMDERVKYIRQANAGVSAARNTGIEAARGEYVAFLDSDDAWLPWKLEAQLSVLRAFPDAGMVWSDMKAVNEKGSILHESYLKLMYGSYAFFDRETVFRTSRSLSDIWKSCPAAFADRKCYTGNIFSWMFMGNLVHTSTVLLRRDCQKKVGHFDVSLQKSGEDYDFHFRTCRVGEVAYLDLPAIHYRVGANDQLTEQRYMVWIARNNLKTINKMLSVAGDEIRLPRKMIRDRLARSYAWAGLTEFEENPSKARTCLFRSLQYSPLQARVAAYLLLAFLPPRAVTCIRKLIRKMIR
ncbi:MAG: glycosyltransferase family 2 protein [Deltaproteobacteria bacterium]